MKKIAILFSMAIWMAALAGCSTPAPTALAVTTPTPVLTAAVDTAVVAPAVITPTTGEITVTQVAQPTKLAGNYSGNWAMLRARAKDHVLTLAIPAGAKDARITFKLAKTSTYENVPGNIIVSIDGKHVCNGRLHYPVEGTVDGIYSFPLNQFCTQDKPKCVDLSDSIGKVLTIQAWIGENKNQLNSVTVDYSL